MAERFRPLVRRCRELGRAMRIGTNHALMKPSSIHRQHGTVASFWCLDGAIDELKIFNRTLLPEEVAETFASAAPVADCEIQPRRMPSGPKGPGRFGAVYCKLKYYDGWDELWRVDDHPDVLVRFDQTPVRIVFWRGSRYSPGWVTNEDQWMADQSVEAWKTGKADTDGCFEHMQDRLCRYSHVRIIESHDARTVVHWRYAPVSSKNNLWNVDEKTGRGCWVDEYYTIYPDAIGVRKPTWKTGTLGGPRQFQESLPFTNPDQYNNDVVELDFCTVANMQGEQLTLRFVDSNTRFPELSLLLVIGHLHQNLAGFDAITVVKIDRRHLDQARAIANHVEFQGRGIGQVDNAIVNERTAVIDADNNRTPISDICDLDLCIKRNIPHGSGQLAIIKYFIVCRGFKDAGVCF